MRWKVVRQPIRKVRNYNIMKAHTRYIKNVNLIPRATRTLGKFYIDKGEKKHLRLKDYATLWKCDIR